MPQVDTVLGPIDAGALGPTLMHEHVFTCDPDFQHNRPWVWGDSEVRIADAARRLDELYEVGVRTIVDLTVLGLGRDISLVEAVAKRTKIQIVVATGVYTFDDVPRPFRMRGPGTLMGGTEPMVAMFLDEIEHGIAHTEIRPAILKCATGPAGVTPGVERVLRAVAATHRRTGLPITTHSVASLRQGVDQQRIFEEEGVELSRVVIGHCGDATDIDYLVGLANKGSYLGLDQFGIEFLRPLEGRISLVVDLCRRGLADHIVLSQDFACYADIMDDETRKRLNPTWSYTCVSERVIPELLRAGVSQADIDTMLIHNPVRILGRDAVTGPATKVFTHGLRSLVLTRATVNSRDIDGAVGQSKGEPRCQ